MAGFFFALLKVLGYFRSFFLFLHVSSCCTGRCLRLLKCAVGPLNIGNYDRYIFC